MARRTSRRRRRSRRRRSTRRNPRYVVANRRRRRRRMRRNQGFLGGVRWGREVIVPVLGGTAGFIAARYLGNLAAMKDWGTTDPKKAKLGAAAIGIPATFLLARQVPTISRHSGPIVLGMGLAAAEAWLRETPILGDGASTAALTTAPNGNGDGIMPGAPIPEQDLPGEVTVVENGGGDNYTTDQNSELADYYTEGMLGGLGADPGNQASVENSLDRMESVSTVIPTDLALRARRMPQFASVHERFANRGDRGHAGGLFARHLFSGMMGG